MQMVRRGRIQLQEAAQFRVFFDDAVLVRVEVYHFEDLDREAEEVASLEEDLALAGHGAGEFGRRTHHDEADLVGQVDHFGVVEAVAAGVFAADFHVVEEALRRAGHQLEECSLLLGRVVGEVGEVLLFEVFPLLAGNKVDGLVRRMRCLW